MKTLRWCLIAFLAAGLLGGCSGVRMSAEYSKLLDDTVAVSQEVAQRAKDGQMSDKDMAGALADHAELWKLFQDARDGKAGK